MSGSSYFDVLRPVPVPYNWIVRHGQTEILDVIGWSALQWQIGGLHMQELEMKSQVSSRLP